MAKPMNRRWIATPQNPRFLFWFVFGPHLAVLEGESLALHSRITPRMPEIKPTCCAIRLGTSISLSFPLQAFDFFIMF